MNGSLQCLFNTVKGAERTEIPRILIGENGIARHYVALMAATTTNF